MNFGHKIAVVIALFLIFIVSLVVFTAKQKDIFLVSEDYYKKEIAYQGEIEKYENAKGLSQPVKIAVKEQTVHFFFPQELEQVQGEIYFYRPSNAALDFKVPIKLAANNTQEVVVEGKEKGRWVAKIEWESEGVQYQKEEKIRL